MPKIVNKFLLISLVGIPFLNGCLSTNSSSTSSNQVYMDAYKTEIENLKNNTSCFLKDDVQDCKTQFDIVENKIVENAKKDTNGLNEERLESMRRYYSYLTEEFIFAAKGCSLKNRDLCFNEKIVLINLTADKKPPIRDLITYYTGYSLDELIEIDFNDKVFSCEVVGDALSCEDVARYWIGYNYTQRLYPDSHNYWEKYKNIASKLNKDKAVDYLYKACIFNKDYCYNVAKIYSKEGLFSFTLYEDRNKELTFHRAACNSDVEFFYRNGMSKVDSCIAVGNYHASKGDKKKAMDCYQTNVNFNPNSKEETLKYGKGYITEKDYDLLKKNYQPEKIIKCDL